VGLFRKRETYNQQMLREAGLDRVVFNEPPPAPAPEPVTEAAPPAPADDWSVLTRHGRLGPKEWDAATTTTAPGVVGDRVSFVTLPNGDLIIEEEEGNGDLTPLADAVEEHVSPPYRAAASRQSGDLWGVGARRIEVAAFPFPDADALELSRNDGETELRADGEPSGAAVPVELQRLGERTGANFCVEATRIDGDSWEVKVSPL
jgi:hypothetical protein